MNTEILTVTTYWNANNCIFIIIINWHTYIISRSNFCIISWIWLKWYIILNTSYLIISSPGIKHSLQFNMALSSIYSPYGIVQCIWKHFNLFIFFLIDALIIRFFCSLTSNKIILWINYHYCTDWLFIFIMIELNAGNMQLAIAVVVTRYTDSMIRTKIQ